METTIDSNEICGVCGKVYGCHDGAHCPAPIGANTFYTDDEHVFTRTKTWKELIKQSALDRFEYKVVDIPVMLRPEAAEELKQVINEFRD